MNIETQKIRQAFIQKLLQTIRNINPKNIKVQTEEMIKIVTISTKFDKLMDLQGTVVKDHFPNLDLKIIAPVLFLVTNDNGTVL